MKLFEFGPNVSDLQLLKSLDPAVVKDMGINIEDLEKSLEMDLSKGREGLVPQQKVVTRNGKQVTTTVYVRPGDKQSEGKEKASKKEPTEKPKKKFSYMDPDIGDSVTFKNEDGKEVTGKFSSRGTKKLGVTVDGKKYEVPIAQITKHNGNSVGDSPPAPHKKDTVSKKKDAPKKKDPTPTVKKDDKKETTSGNNVTVADAVSDRSSDSRKQADDKFLKRVLTDLNMGRSPQVTEKSWPAIKEAADKMGINVTKETDKHGVIQAVYGGKRKSKNPPKDAGKDNVKSSEKPKNDTKSSSSSNKEKVADQIKRLKKYKNIQVGTQEEVKDIKEAASKEGLHITSNAVVGGGPRGRTYYDINIKKLGKFESSINPNHRKTPKDNH